MDTDALTGTWTTYNLRVYYFTYDITAYLTPGVNTIGVMLGAAWHDVLEFPPLQDKSPCDLTNPMMLRAAVVDLATQAVLVASDGLWTGTDKGPVVSAEGASARAHMRMHAHTHAHTHTHKHTQMHPHPHTSTTSTHTCVKWEPSCRRYHSRRFLERRSLPFIVAHLSLLFFPSCLLKYVLVLWCRLLFRQCTTARRTMRDWSSLAGHPPASTRPRPGTTRPSCPSRALTRC